MYLKIIVESHIPYIDGTLDRVPGVTVLRLPPERISPQTVADADALIVRTRTKCDSRLLEGSKVRFIATATIGTDHIDLGWCKANGITVASAPGCNAPAVAQYVLSSLLRLKGEELLNCSLGIIGAGHVGSITARWAEGLGIRTLLCDPPRARAEGETGFVNAGTLLSECDIITYHVPLTHSGPDATYHMCDSGMLSKCKPSTLIVNAARGAVVDTDALCAAIEARKVARPVIDCWEGEPDISRRLLSLCDIATPHIAGYSAQGKLRATIMVLNALGQHFGLQIPNIPQLPTVPEYVTAQQLLDSYDPTTDTAALRAATLPDGFERLRNNYHLRNEPC